MSWRRFFRRKQWDEERARELDAYLAIETDENLARGISPEEARYAARRKLGNSTLIREEIYRMNSIGFFETVWQDVRYAARTLMKSRAFTLVVIVSLALGIGANTAIFSLVDAALLKMLPVKDPEQLVQFKVATQGALGEGFSYPAYKEFRDHNRAFSGVLAFERFFSDPNIEADGQSGIAKSQMVSGNYFSVLGIKPVIGRLITPADEDVAGQSPVAVISYEYWRRRFTLDPAVVGKKVILNNIPFTLIGVTPPEFFGLQPGERIEVSIPITMKGQVNPSFAFTGTRQDILVAPYRTWLSIMGRLKPGVTSKKALAELQPLFYSSMREAAAALSGLSFDSPDARRAYLSSKLQVDSAGQGLAALRKQFSKPLWILMAAVLLLLLVTCANVANLLLARAGARQREIAVRLTTGAGRWRLIRQLITESSLLALAGGVVGLLLAFWADKFLVMLMSHSNSPVSLTVQPDLKVLGFTLLVSLFTALLFGFLPAWRATRPNLTAALVESTRNAGRGGSRSRLGKVLVIAQVAVSLVLLIGAGLLARTLQNLQNFYPGFNKEGVLLLTVYPEVIGYDLNQSARLYERLLDRISGVPGVRSATFSFYRPLRVLGLIIPKVQEVTPLSVKATARVGIDDVGPNYFTTLETPIVSGRDFTPSDRAGAPKVVVVNEAMARLYFGASNPIGKHLTVPDWNGDPNWKEIIGVVKDANNRGLREPPVPMIYLPLFQFPDEGLITFQVRTAVNRLSVSNSIQRAIKAVEPRLPVFDVKTLNQQVDDSLVQERLIASLSSLFGALALLLAAVGLYGLMTYATNRRTGEIGIRMALGATRWEIASMVLRETLLLVLAGLAIGVPAAAASSHLIRSELYGLRASDPLTMLIASLIMAGIAASAAYLPARRASRVDPMVALRTE